MKRFIATLSAAAILATAGTFAGCNKAAEGPEVSPEQQEAIERVRESDGSFADRMRAGRGEENVDLNQE